MTKLPHICSLFCWKTLYFLSLWPIKREINKKMVTPILSHPQLSRVWNNYISGAGWLWAIVISASLARITRGMISPHLSSPPSLLPSRGISFHAAPPTPPSSLTSGHGAELGAGCRACAEGWGLARPRRLQEAREIQQIVFIRHARQEIRQPWQVYSLCPLTRRFFCHQMC